ncbi:hypothetical protein [Thiothrix subterranea]|uniref:hypothetical protein n=1 Tax=Thiothrix subterranea TaxID=2735563 RepID=UPI00280BCD55|nr:hypothetical protein [Thiothrix subterranea]
MHHPSRWLGQGTGVVAGQPVGDMVQLFDHLQRVELADGRGVVDGLVANALDGFGFMEELLRNEVLKIRLV